MKKLITGLSLALILAIFPWGMMGCEQTDNGSETESMTKENTEKDTEKNTEKSTEQQVEGVEIDLAENIDKLKLWGRYQTTPSGIACDHTASGIEFNGVMKGKVYIDIRCNGDAYFTVFIDGVRQPERHQVYGGRKATRLKIAEFSTEGEHNIRVLKQTESRYATANFITLVLDGELTAAPKAADTYIEFIGDSISCGMGNLGDNSLKDGAAQNAFYEDGTLGYAFLAAEALGADYSIVSQSGIGIAGSWFDPIKDFYTKLSYSRDRNTDNDFSRVPDIVVINLGTNDYHLNKIDKDKCKPEQVQTATAELIELVRGSYGKDVTIVWAYGAMGECMFDSVKAAIDGLGGEDAGIYTIELPESRGGGEGHPDKNGHELLANTLKDFILEIQG